MDEGLLDSQPEAGYSKFKSQQIANDDAAYAPPAMSDNNFLGLKNKKSGSFRSQRSHMSATSNVSQ